MGVVSMIIATGIAEILTLPVCTVKTNYQNNKIPISQVIRQIYTQQGISGFYRASFPALGSQILSSTMKFNLYRQITPYIQVDNRFIQLPIASFLGSVITSLFTHPLDYFKIHLQMNSTTKPVFKNMYQGYSKSLAKLTVGSLTFLPIYDLSNDHLKNPILSSMMSSIISTIIIHPFDYQKTRHIYGISPWHGIQITQYYRGLSLNLARVIPHFTIMMSINAWLSSK